MGTPLGLITYSMYPSSLSKLGKKWNMAAFEFYGDQSMLNLAIDSARMRFARTGSEYRLAVEYTQYSRLTRRVGKMSVEDVKRAMGDEVIEVERSFFDDAVDELEMTREEYARSAGSSRQPYALILDPSNTGQNFTFIEKQRAHEFASEIEELEKLLIEQLAGFIKRIRE